MFINSTQILVLHFTCSTVYKSLSSRKICNMFAQCIVHHHNVLTQQKNLATVYSWGTDLVFQLVRHIDLGWLVLIYLFFIFYCGEWEGGEGWGVVWMSMCPSLRCMLHFLGVDTHLNMNIVVHFVVMISRIRSTEYTLTGTVPPHCLNIHEYSLIVIVRFQCFK